MPFYADLHVHSKYSRATSGDCDLEHLAAWALRKGIAVVGTGDFTHPGWAEELRGKLVPAEPGLFRLRPEIEREVARSVPPSCAGIVRFLLQVEISTIYKKAGRTRKVHHLVYAPDLDQAGAVTARLAAIGNLSADGRPILGLDSRDLLEIVLEAAPGGFLVPAHIWTPWFAVLGSSSGFDSVEECFGDLTRHVFALETGLSSDPPMNWRLSALDRYRLVSNSDAHSPPKLGREVTVFDTALDYFAMRAALETGAGHGGTVEFFPEEGKYHLDGHRACGQRLTPEQTRAAGGTCPACGKPVTVGVLHRVEVLADRPEGSRPAGAAPFRSLVPLPEILAEIHEVGAGSQRVARSYERLVQRLGPELAILESVPLEEARRTGPELLGEALSRLRRGEATRRAGYDGEYGVVRLFDPAEIAAAAPSAFLFGPPVGQRAKSGRGEPGEHRLEPLPGPPEFELAANAKGAESGSPRAAEPVHSEGDTAPSVIFAAEAREARAELAKAPVLSARAEAASPDSRALIGLNEPPGAPACGSTGERSSGLPDRPGADASPLLAGLDPEQRLAATLREGPVLIVAGPGTGKTRTLTHRLAWLVEGGVSAEACLAVTFTRRAAAELRERLERLLPGRAAELTVTTFHGLGLLLLRAYGDRLGLPPEFRVIDPDEQEALAEKALDRAPRSSRRLLSEISRHKRTRTEPDPDSETALAFAGYQHALADAGAVDYDDLVRLPVALLERFPEILAEARRRYAWVSVDEFQDVDPLQYRLLELLVPPAGNLCAIGDPDQSIYGFRGSDVALFWRFLEDRPSARQVRLGRNYRSAGPILDAAVQAIRPATLVPGRALEAMAIGGRKVALHAAASERAEAEFVVHTLEKLLAGHTFFSLDTRRAEGAPGTDLSFGEIAVLFRTEAQGEALSEAFARSGLPFQTPASDPEAWDPRAERIALLTLHAAKGLEFRVVFITGCEDGLMPLRFGGAPADSAEERRLFFVGMTRARERLFLSWSRKRLIRGAPQPREPSPFLLDIEKALLEEQEAERRRSRPDASRQLPLF